MNIPGRVANFQVVGGDLPEFQRTKYSSLGENGFLGEHSIPLVENAIKTQPFSADPVRFSKQETFEEICCWLPLCDDPGRPRQSPIHVVTKAKVLLLRSVDTKNFCSKT